MRGRTAGVEDLNDFHRRCLLAVRQAHMRRERGFDMDDIVEFMYSSSVERRQNKERLRDWIGRHDSSVFPSPNALYHGTGWSLHPSILKLVQDGLWVLVDPDDFLLGLSRQDLLRHAAEKRGGVIKIGELRDEFGYVGGAGRTRLKRDLQGCDSFEHANLPWHGWRTARALKNREKIIIAGEKAIIRDLRICNAEQGRSVGDLTSTYWRRLQNVSNTLLEVRDRIDATVTNLLTPQMLDQINNDCCACDARLHQEDEVTVTVWWTDLMRSKTLELAAQEAWWAMEDGAAPGLSAAFSLRMWRLLEDRTRCDSAAMCRGRIEACPLGADGWSDYTRLTMALPSLPLNEMVNLPSHILN